MGLLKDYDMDIVNLQNAIKKLDDNIQTVFDYLKNEVNELRKEMEVMKKEIDNLKNVSTNTSKNENEINIMKKRIFDLNTKIERLESMLDKRTITKIELNTFHLSKAQELLLNFCEIPRSFKEMEEFMRDHNLTMGAHFQKLKDLGLIRKENDKWVRVKEITKT